MQNVETTTLSPTSFSSKQQYSSLIPTIICHVNRAFSSIPAFLRSTLSANPPHIFPHSSPSPPPQFSERARSYSSSPLNPPLSLLPSVKRILRSELLLLGWAWFLCLAMMSMLTMRNCFPVRVVLFRPHLLKHQHLLLVNRLKDLEKFLYERVTNSLEILQLIQNSSVPIPFNPIILFKLQMGNHNKQLAIPCPL